MMTTHVLLTVDEYAAHKQTLHPSQLAVVEVNVAVGNAVSLCSCGIVISAPERHLVHSRYVAHLKASPKPRRLGFGGQ